MYYLLLLLLPLQVFASRLDPIIISSKTNSSSSNMTSSHQVINSFDLEDQNLSNAVESLRNLPGIYVNQAGGPGAQASIYIRGSEVRHILVLIDGVKVNDPSNPDKQFNAANLTSLDIEKIEIIKGAQSVLYGSDAIGGVINIITKKGEPKQSVDLELGIQKQISGTLSIVRGRSVTYINGYSAQSDGISAKKDGDELDGYKKQGVTINHSHSFENFEAHWMFKMMHDRVDDDRYNSSYQLVDDKEAYSKSLQQIYKQSLIFNRSYGSIKYNISFNKTDRKVKIFDTKVSKYVENIYSGSRIIQDLIWLKKFGKGEAVAGLTHEYETFNQSHIHQRKVNLYSIYTSVNHSLGRNILNIGLRNDIHETFGSIFTYNLGIGRKFSGRKIIKFNHATGFKAPSIYQLYVPYDGGSKVGNKNLIPEKSRTFDLSFKKMGRTNYEVSIFNNYIYDYFYYSSDGYSNKGSFNSQGIEFSRTEQEKNWSLKEGITLAQFDLSGSDNVLRRPEQKVDLGLSYKINDATSLNYDWRWVAARFDKSGGKEVILNAYDLSNIHFRYKYKGDSYHLGLNNLFDREYVDIYGYGTLGLTFFAKAQLNY